MIKKEFVKKILTEGGVEEIVGREELEEKLMSGKKMIIKYGADPTRPDLHLGHAVILRKLRQFQDLGHKVIFLIGDATTKIGDPTGKDKTRPAMTNREIKQNAKTYIRQVSKILKTDKKLLGIRFNSEWFSKMSMFEFLKLMTMTTAARVMERDMFEKRMESGKDIGLHELVYPVMQGYDSVELKDDLALLGNDQKFNELFGRHYQQKFNQAPQSMMIMKLLVGLDGKEKMSKSLDNYIGVTENADSMYGKVMSVPDDVMEEYFRLATDVPLGEIFKIAEDLKKNKLNPRDVKMKLAFEITKVYHGEERAQEAQDNFVRVFQKKELPKKVKSVIVKGSGIKLTEFLTKSGSAKSLSDARRKIEQGAVELDSGKVKDYTCRLTKDKYNKSVLKVGKLKFYRIVFR